MTCTNISHLITTSNLEIIFQYQFLLLFEVRNLKLSTNLLGICSHIPSVNAASHKIGTLDKQTQWSSFQLQSLFWFEHCVSEAWSPFWSFGLFHSQTVLNLYFCTNSHYWLSWMLHTKWKLFRKIKFKKYSNLSWVKLGRFFINLHKCYLMGWSFDSSFVQIYFLWFSNTVSRFFLIPLILCWIVSDCRATLSEVFPLGSPMCPVAPPNWKFVILHLYYISRI